MPFQDDVEALVTPAADGVPHGAFLLSLAGFVAPLVAALLQDGIYVGADEPRYVRQNCSAAGLAFWLLLCAALYVLQYALAWRRRWKYNEKTAARHKEDLLRQSLLCGLAYGSGIIGGRLAEAPLAFTAYVVAFTLGYCVLFEQLRAGNVEFTANCVGNTHAVAVAVFAAALVGGLVAHTMFRISFIASLNANAPSLANCAALVLVILAAHAALVLSPGSSAHFHHYYLGFVGSCLCTLSTDTSMVAQCMLLGIYLHGTSLFGVERVFYPDGADPASPY
jgi:hypothetical protein